MKKTITSLMLVLFVLAGCTTTSWQNNAGKTLATTAQTVDVAMKGWAMYVVTTNPPAEQQDKVRTAYGQYQAAFNIALTAYSASVTLKDATIFDQAAVTLAASSGDVLSLISTFKPKPQSQPIKP